MKRYILLAIALLGVTVSLATTSSMARAEEVSRPDNMVVWFEIPVTDMDRAVAFYNSIFAIQMNVDASMGIPMAFFPGTEATVTGALIQMENVHPGPTGPIVYLNGGNDLQVVLDRVEAAGGRVCAPKTLISESIGYFAIFMDTEGNRLGLFSRN